MSFRAIQHIGFMKVAEKPFIGGNETDDSILSFARRMGRAAAAGVTAGGTLSINSQAMGSYDYVIKEGNQTVSSFVNGDWFTATADSRSAWVVVRGDLTIDAGQTFIPSNRKLFTVIYVKGNLIVNGGLSMSARGAYHGAAGGNVAAVAIRIANGTHGGVSNPQVPAAGGGGGAGVGASSGGGDATAVGNPGAAGADGGCGGGGSGGVRASNGFSSSSQNGAAATCFGGAPASGGCNASAGGSLSGFSPTASGGPGAAGRDNAGVSVGGGAGNDGGVGANGGGSGQNGTGGVLIFIVEGALSGSGTITAAGVNGGESGTVGGGASGGGSITGLVKGSDTGPTPTAAGGTATGASVDGGAGGAGTARKLALAA